MSCISRVNEKREQLEQQIAALQAELAELRVTPCEDATTNGDADRDVEEGRWPLPLTHYRRYGRQMIVPEIGLQGTKSSSLD